MDDKMNPSRSFWRTAAGRLPLALGVFSLALALSLWADPSSAQQQEPAASGDVQTDLIEPESTGDQGQPPAEAPAESAAATGDQPSAGDPAPSAEEPPPAKPYTPEELQELAEVQNDLKRFRQASEDYRSTVDRIVKRAYEGRREDILSKYKGEIEQQEEEERTRRIAAITLFEDFLRRYPADKRWTPDVIFRLAELYFEKSNDQYLTAQARYEEQLKLAEKGMAATPVPPRQDYSQTIALHRRLIKQWPTYRLIDGAYYLLGFCLQEMGEFDRGNVGLLALVCANKFEPPLSDAPEAPAEGESERSRPNISRALLERRNEDPFAITTDMYDDCKPLAPKGRFNAEAWTRIGEYHFDENQLGPAIASYKRVLAIGPKDNPYYDEALYKLAWTYYRADKFEEAIRRFDNLVVYADKEFERTGKAGSEMRPEAIQYLGISFAEEDWNADQQPDANAGLPRLESEYRDRKDEKHVYEIYRRLGEIYFDTARYAEAIEVYKLTLDRWPYNPENPDIQDKIIVALERMRDFEAAIAEREEFTRRFGKGTEWEKRNRNNPEALRKAREYDEQALIQAAVHHHKLGQDLRKRGIALKDVDVLRKASEEYAVAAQAYERYLERFPNSKNSYEIRYSYASCLYFSERYLEAAQVYAQVRDSNLDNRYQEPAAFSATKAYEVYIDNQKASNALTEPELPTAKTTGTEPLPMPDPYQNWQKSLDSYAKVLPSSAKTPRLSYKAAEIAYRFKRFPEARERFATLYDKHCEDPMAVTAGQAILVTYQLEKNLDKMQEWATKLSSGKCGGDAKAGDVQAGAKKLLVGIKFKRAEALFAKAEKLYEAGNKQEAAPVYDKAAAAYLALVDANPDSEDADKALFNAAVAYEKSMRFESATKIYERVWQKYPQSDLAASALWRSAENYKRFFEFKKAVNNYLIMADAPRFEGDENRVNAIYNAAVLLENDQAYGRAATLFLRYAEQADKPKEAAEAYFRAGLIYEKMNDTRNMQKVFESFNRQYGSVEGQSARVVDGLYRLAKAAEKRGNRRDAKRYYGQTISQYNARGLQPASDAAEFAASAEFALLQPDMKDFLKQKINTRSLNAVVAGKKKLERKAVALRNRYDKLLQYKRARWTLAAMFRRGEIFEHVARVVAEAFRGLKVPAKVRRLGQDAVDIYMDQLDQALEREVRPLEEETKKLYALTVERATQLGVSNTYTEQAQERLNALDPTNYPLLKSPQVEVAID
jgi:tetratricopeptide (TPR) repeat protein